MFEDEMRKKIEKAKNYVEQPERFKLQEMKLKMDSMNDIREITYKDGIWSCTCDFFKKANTCSHTMAAKELIKFKMDER